MVGGQECWDGTVVEWRRKDGIREEGRGRR